jgi:hypothetical protein
LLESNLILCNGFNLRTSQEAIQEEKVQILYRCVSVDSSGHVFADMKLKGAALLMILGVRPVGLNTINTSIITLIRNPSSQ